MKILFAILLFPLAMAAQPKVNSGLTHGASLLFKNTTSKLSVAEKNDIYRQLKIMLSKNKKQFVDVDDKDEDAPYGEADVYPTDLNKDGIEEICVILYNQNVYGNTGSGIFLFIKQAAGKYQEVLSLPAADLTPLSTQNLGYPDLLIGVPGLNFPVWRWNCKNYALYKTIAESQLPKNAKGIADVSKTYQAAIKN